MVEGVHSTVNSVTVELFYIHSMVLLERGLKIQR